MLWVALLSRKIGARPCCGVIWRRSGGAPVSRKEFSKEGKRGAPHYCGRGRGGERGGGAEMRLLLLNASCQRITYRARS